MLFRDGQQQSGTAKDNSGFNKLPITVVVLNPKSENSVVYTRIIIPQGKCITTL